MSTAAPIAERGIDLVPITHIGVPAKAIDRKAKREGAGPRLDRLAVFDESRAENARRIERRPEIVLDLVSREKSVFDERDIAKVLHRYVDDPGTFLQSPDVVRLQAEGIDFATGARTPARLTTRELIRLEADIARRAIGLAGTDIRGGASSSWPTSRKTPGKPEGQTHLPDRAGGGRPPSMRSLINSRSA